VNTGRFSPLGRRKKKLWR